MANTLKSGVMGPLQASAMPSPQHESRHGRAQV